MRFMAATVKSTASLIALSAQARRCAPCICSANSPSRALKLVGIAEQASESTSFHKLNGTPQNEMASYTAG